MTIEQAIQILHPDTTTETLERISYYAGSHSEETVLKIVKEACVVACEIMQKYLLEHEETPKGKKRYTM